MREWRRMRGWREDEDEGVEGGRGGGGRTRGWREDEGVEGGRGGGGRMRGWREDEGVEGGQGGGGG